MTFKVPEDFRVKSGRMGSYKSVGNNGYFRIRSLKFKVILTCIASDGAGWEHVSVSIYNKCPGWDHMSFIKDLFWSDDDCVIQFHPPKEDYISCHPYCLHLWRRCDTNDYVERPDSILVGPKDI